MAKSVKELDEQEQLLLMRYHDGECSYLERVMAERLLRNSEPARYQIESFTVTGGMLQDFCESAWSQVSCSSEDKLLQEIGSQTGRVVPDHGSSSLLNWDWTGWLFGLGWASSGALVTAGLVLLFGSPATQNLQLAEKYGVQDASVASFVNATEQSKGPIMATASSEETSGLPEASGKKGFNDNKVVYPVLEPVSEPIRYGSISGAPLEEDYSVPQGGAQ